MKTSFSGLMGSIKGGLKELDVTPEIALERSALTQAAYRAACEKGDSTASMRVTNVAVLEPAADAGALRHPAAGFGAA
ncbi:hypothetical protein LP419_05060 [Massilia sp. H-1]|nr:hypothetical protein LP419_05060 [Massilia sp. H-1]